VGIPRNTVCLPVDSFHIAVSIPRVFPIPADAAVYSIPRPRGIFIPADCRRRCPLVEVAEEVDHSPLCTSRRHLHRRVAFVGLDARVGVSFLYEEPGDGDVAVGSGVVQRRAACSNPNQLRYSFSSQSTACFNSLLQ